MENTSIYPNKYKIAISIVIGLLTLILSPYSISTHIGSIQIDITWQLIAPLTISLAFGWQFGLITAVFGASLFPFLLWPNNGYANVGNFFMFTAIICSTGFINHSAFIKFEKSLFRRLIYTIAISTIIAFVQIKLLFANLLTLNPAFWTSHTINMIPQEITSAILFKEVFNIIFLTIIAETSLKVPIVRKMLGLPVVRAYQQNQSIFIYTIIVAISFWVLLIALDIALFQDFTPFNNPIIILSLLLIILSGFIVSRAIFHYSSQEFFAKEKLKRNEMIFRLLAENLSDIIIRQDLNNNLLYLSPACKTILGYSPDDLVGKSFKSLMHPNDTINLPWPKSTLETTSFNVRLECKNEIYRWFEVNSKMVLIPNSNNATEIHSSLKDITTRIEAERKLQDSQQMFSEMVLNSPGIIYQYYITNKGVRGFHFISPKAKDMLSLNNHIDNWDEFNLEQVIHPEDRERFTFLLIDSYQKLANFHFEGRIITPIGEHWVEVNSRPSIFEDETRYNGIITIITERKLNEIKLAESENRYRTILANITDYVYTVTIKEGAPIETKHNETCLAITGYTSKEFSDNPNLWLEMVYEHDRDAVIEKTMKAAEGVIIAPFEHRIRCKNGEIRWISNVIISKFDDKQKLIGYDGVIEDVTDRKLAEEIIKDSELKFIEMAANVPGIIFQYFVRDNGTKGYYYISPKSEEIIGIKIDIFNFDQILSDLIHPDDKNKYEDAYSIALLEKSELNLECRLITPNGVVWIQILSHPKKENKEYVFNGIITNITQRKKAETALKSLATSFASLSGKAFYEAVCNHIASILSFDYVFIGEIDHDTFEVTVLGGYANGEPMGELVYSLSETPCAIVSNSSICYYLEDVQNSFPNDDLLKIMGIQGYIGIPIKDKEERVIGLLVGLNSTPITQIENINSIFNIFVDRVSAEIATQKTTEALNESEKKLRTLFSSMTEMVLISDLVYNDKNRPIDYQIRDCNNAFLETTSFKKEEIIDKCATDIWQTKSLPYFENIIKVAQTGEPFDYQYFDQKLDKHFMVSVVSPQKDRFATITTDITSLKLVQEEIVEKNKELENYLYITSHDLRTPLVNIQGFSLRLQKQTNAIKDIANQCQLDTEKREDITKITDELIPKALEYIFTNITKMDSLISGLLQISRTGRLKMTISEVQINDLINSIISAHNFQLSEIGAEVKIDELPNCHGDQHLLNQLFSNILSNAIKYRDTNRPLKIYISGKTKFNKTIYSIKDNGIGIEQRHITKIWDVFFRVDNQLVGEGLGLSLVKCIIDKHKGKIWAESTFGEGSTFFIELQKSNFSE